MNYLKGMWADLDSKGRTTFVICITVLAIAAIAAKVDLSWVPTLLLGAGQ